MKLFPNFTSIQFDYLLISWVTNYVSNLGFLILDHINRELHSLKCLDLKFGCKVHNVSDFFGKIPVRVLLDVLLCVQDF